MTNYEIDENSQVVANICEDGEFVEITQLVEDEIICEIVVTRSAALKLAWLLLEELEFEEKS